MLWGLVIIVLTNLSLSATIELFAPKIRDPEHGYRLAGLQELQQAAPNRPLVVFVGSSHSQNAIDPEAMDFTDQPGTPVVFNYSLTGAQPPHLPMMIRRLRDCGIQPNALLVEIFPAALATTDTDQTLFAYSGAGLTLTDLWRLTPATRHPMIHTRWVLSRLLPWSSFRLILISHINEDWLPWESRPSAIWKLIDSRGFAAYADTPKRVELRRPMRLEWVRGEYAGILADLNISELSMRSYRELVADCRSHGIPVAFYITPESPIFRSWYSPESQKRVAAFCRMLREELGCSVFVATNDFAETDFGDGHHILPQSAAKYSRWLANTYLRPWLAEVLK